VIPIYLYLSEQLHREKSSRQRMEESLEELKKEEAHQKSTHTELLTEIQQLSCDNQMWYDFNFLCCFFFFGFKIQVHLLQPYQYYNVRRTLQPPPKGDGSNA
jgi:hypothetical protein